MGTPARGQQRSACTQPSCARRRCRRPSLSTVIQHPGFPPEPWRLRETELRLDWLAQTESVFALANGHVGLRGNLDEGEPSGLPGTYLGGFHEVRPLSYPEAGYGYPEVGRSVVNATDGKVIRLLVEDEPFDVRYGELRSHERVLDFRDGVLRRTAEWRSPTGRLVRVSSTRLVSFTQRAVAAILYEVEAPEETLPVVVQSELVTNEPLPSPTGDPPPGRDPRHRTAFGVLRRPRLRGATGAFHRAKPAAAGRGDGPHRRSPRRA